MTLVVKKWILQYEAAVLKLQAKDKEMYQCDNSSL